MDSQYREYKKSECAVVFKTKELYGGLSNMAGGYPLELGGVRIRTAEALYQALRYPCLSGVQRSIVDHRSPMSAKMESKKNYGYTREDWMDVRVPIMRWCLRVKRLQNWEKMSEVLLSTEDKPIVELSYKCDFWGAKPKGDYLCGTNALGRLLMELREWDMGNIKQGYLESPNIPHFLLFNKRVEALHVSDFLQDA